MDIIGVQHKSEYLDGTFQAIDESFVKLKGKKQEIVVGLELTKRRLSKGDFFGQIAKDLIAIDNSRKMSGKIPRIRVVYLDSPYGHKIGCAVFEKVSNGLFEEITKS
jgi:hypothetical protein